jgi:hypothetical protein
MKNTHICRHVDSLIDIIESDSFCLKGGIIHCTFPLESEDKWLNSYFLKSQSKGMKQISFTNGVIINIEDFRLEL